MGRARQRAPNEFSHGHPPSFNPDAAENVRNTPKRRRPPRLAPIILVSRNKHSGRFGRGVSTRGNFRQREPGRAADQRDRLANSAPADPILSFTRADCLPRPLRRWTCVGGASVFSIKPCAPTTRWRGDAFWSWGVEGVPISPKEALRLELPRIPGEKSLDLGPHTAPPSTQAAECILTRDHLAAFSCAIQKNGRRLLQ